ncbi:MAG: NAD(P)/FAD-dependent oxidoreductase [Acidobacteria bacterium]|nr:NAD(P)/FAD-dependent oxidoreductase [Acidobacteriota bacterium]
MDTYDVVIVGGGPAGLSAAVVLGRCRRRVLVCDSGRYRNAASHALHNYLGHDGIAPAELLRLGRVEALRYGVELREGVVVGARCAEDGVEVLLEGGESVRGRKLLLATGMLDELPRVAGAAELYGRGVFHCPYCDGWELKDQPLAAYGDAEDAIVLASSLRAWSPSVTACLDGRPMPRGRHAARARALGIDVRREKIARLVGGADGLERVEFESGPALACRGLFFSTRVDQRSSLAARLGCTFDKRGHVRTDRKGRAGVPQLFLAGDANGDVQFAVVAAAEGAKAAVAINHELTEAGIPSPPPNRDLGQANADPPSLATFSLPPGADSP